MMMKVRVVISRAKIVYIELHVNGIILYLLFCTWLPLINLMFLRLNKILHVSLVHFFNTAVQYEYNTFYVSITLLFSVLGLL